MFKSMEDKYYHELKDALEIPEEALTTWPHMLAQVRDLNNARKKQAAKPVEVREEIDELKRSIKDIYLRLDELKGRTAKDEVYGPIKKDFNKELEEFKRNLKPFDLEEIKKIFEQK